MIRCTEEKREQEREQEGRTLFSKRGKGVKEKPVQSTHDQGVRGTHAVKSQIESAEFLIDSFVEDPIQIEAYEIVAVGISDWNPVSILQQVDGHHLIVFRQRNLPCLYRSHFINYSCFVMQTLALLSFPCH